jgi:hypothetical protein
MTTRRIGLKTIGYVYGFSNPSMPNMLKIGMTIRTPEIRLKEANKSNTWLPTPFVIEFAKRVKSPKKKEKHIHSLLFDRRINPKREFFRISVKEAKEILNSISVEDYAQEDVSSYAEWLTNNCIENELGKVSLRELSTKSGMSPDKVLHFMKNMGFKCHKMFPDTGKYTKYGFKNIETLYFTEKINLK